MTSSVRWCLASFLLVAAGQAFAEPLRVAYSYWFACAPLHIAEAHGFWTKRGLDVKITTFATGQEVNAAMKAGEIDVGYDMIGSWFDLAQQGVPIVIVGETDWSNGGDKFMVRAGKELAALKGQPVVIYQKSSAVLLFMREVLKREKMAISDFKIVEMAEDEKMKAAFAESRVHLAMSYDPIAQQIVDSGAAVLATTADFPGVMPEGFAARREYVTPEGDAKLEKFFAGWFEAVRYLRDPANRAEVAKLASEKTFAGTEKITEDNVVIYEKTVPVHPAALALKRNDPGAPNIEEFMTSIQVLWHQQGRALPELPLIEYFHLSPIRAAAAADGSAMAAK